MFANHQDMAYSEFLDKMGKESKIGQYTLKEGRRWNADGPDGQKKGDLRLKSILQDIDMESLSFYKDVADLEGLELMQGSLLVERPHYIKKEQLLCLVEGVMHIFLVPHVQRQEVYAGKNIKGGPYDNSDYTIDDWESTVSTSPVNFFAPKEAKYPNFKDANVDKIILDAGDCIFIPAYYFYQFRALNAGPGKSAKNAATMMKYWGRDHVNGAGYGKTDAAMAQVVSLQF